MGKENEGKGEKGKKIREKGRKEIKNQSWCGKKTNHVDEKNSERVLDMLIVPIASQVPDFLPERGVGGY
jgi:hypothetical protein